MSTYKEPVLSFPEFKDHAQKKGMWAGSQLNTDHLTFIKDPNTKFFTKQTKNYSAAMLKYYDEIIVNALDQYTRCPNAPPEHGGPVTSFDFTFEKDTGFFSVRNNGPGIPVEPRPDLGGKYSVEGVITKPFGGSNHEESPDSVTGGINGVGMKVVAANSVHFEIETVDFKRGLYYKQVCRDGMSIIEPPHIVDLKGSDPAKKKLTSQQRTPHTTVRFKLNFPNVCKDNAHKQNPDWYTPENAELIEKLIEFRIYQVALFTQATTYRVADDTRIEYNNPVTTTYNGKTIKVPSIKRFAEMFGIVESVETVLEGPKFPWSICFGDNVTRDHEWALGDAKQLLNNLPVEYMSLINVVHISLQTNHLNPIFKQLTDALKPKAEAALKTTFTPDAFTKLLHKFIYIFDCRQIPVEQIFNSQTKDTIKLGTKMLKDWATDYPIPPKVIAQIWKMIEPKMSFIMLTQTSAKPRKNKYIRKYTPAKHGKQGDKRARECSLVIPEGDSAAKPIEDILKSKKYGLGMDLYGMYNIQGVPPNALKETTVKEFGGKRILQKSQQLQKNVAFQGLVDALNLNYDLEYYTGNDKKRTQLGDKEFATLNYSSIIAAVDQDLDGIGQIFSLIIVFIATFWPCLLKRGFVRRFATPIIRVYARNGNVHEFFSNNEYLTWKHTMVTAEQPETNDEEDGDSAEGAETETEDTKLPGGYEVKYYKGLATHTPEEVAQMGKTFLKNVFTYIWDEGAEKYMEVYFGKDTDKRKDVLSNPVVHEYDLALYKKRQIKCSDHFLIEAHAQKLDFVSRKLKHTLDGMIPVQRMAFAGARKAFGKSNKPKKVYQITGRVTTEMCYEHGDTSMNDTITKMAQNHTGACNLPIFVAISNGFGDRRRERGETGSARYIEAILNSRLTNLMFPPEDDWLLQYEFKEGRQCEPKFYVSIVPYSIIESLHTPAVGWAITTWSRDFKNVLEEVREMIKYDYPNPAGKPQPLGKRFWKKPGMDIEYMIYAAANEGKSEKVTEVCLGSYEVHPKGTHYEITITQLPPQVWSKNFVCNLTGIDPKTDKDTTKTGTKLAKDPKVHTVKDMTCDDEVTIHIALKPGAYEEIMEQYGNEFIDPIEDYFELAKPLNNNINMILDNGTVRTFTKYEEVMEYWFLYRKQMYITRLERRRLLLEFEIDYWQNVERFINMDSKKEIDIDKKPDKERVRILTQAKFTKFNKTRLFKPSYIPIAELRERIYGPDPLSNASYKYIDQITTGQKSQKNLEKLQEKIETLQVKLEKLNQTTYKELWLEELDALESTVDLGLKTNWLYTTKKHKFL
jgi:DNA topoisomerase-2